MIHNIKIYKYKTLLILTLQVICSSIFMSSVNAKTLIVVSTSSPFVNITHNQARSLWLGMKKRLHNMPIIVLDQNQGKTQTEFYLGLLRKSPDEVNAYWTKLVFTEKAYPPTKLTGDKQVKEWLDLNPLAIGYIDASSLDSSVRVLLEIHLQEKLNDEK